LATAGLDEALGSFSGSVILYIYVLRYNYIVVVACISLFYGVVRVNDNQQTNCRPVGTKMSLFTLHYSDSLLRHVAPVIVCERKII
jgi:hypothetical protein